jgi:hypothetical protein
MTKERKNEIKKEATRRLNLWINAEGFDEMTVGGSKIRFDMALGLMGGYPFEPRSWMKEVDFSGFVSRDEFDSNDYDTIIDELYLDAYYTNKAQLEN